MHLLPLYFALSLGTASPGMGTPTHRIHLDVDVFAPVVAPTPEIEVLGGVLAAGVVLPGALHLGLDGQPSMPFLSPFFYQQEIRPSIFNNGQIDPMTLAGQLMVTARVEW